MQVEGQAKPAWEAHTRESTVSSIPFCMQAVWHIGGLALCIPPFQEVTGMCHRHSMACYLLLPLYLQETRKAVLAIDFSLFMLSSPSQAECQGSDRRACRPAVT